MGEHAAVYGQPALVAAADPRARVEVEAAERGVQIDLVDLDRTVETTWEEARTEARRSRKAWQAYAERPSPERFAAIGSGSAESLALLSLGEVAESATELPPPLRLRVRSRLPIGSGFGSSAAIAVAMIGGLQSWLEGTFHLQAVDQMALEVERRQHGLPSGVDHKTVLYGGVVMAVRTSAGDLDIERLGAISPILDRLQVYQTGQPAESTGEVVAQVRRLRDQDPALVDGLLQQMGLTVEAFREALLAEQSDPGVVLDRIREYERCLEALGVVPEGVRETIREVEAYGGGAKISGAGALSGDAAGCLLVYWPEGAPGAIPSALEQYQLQTVELGAEGLRMEDS